MNFSASNSFKNLKGIFYEKDILTILFAFFVISPAFCAEKTYYETYPTFEEAKVGMSKVKYNPDGTIKSMGPLGQVKYNKKGQIEKIGLRKFYYDKY